MSAAREEGDVDIEQVAAAIEDAFLPFAAMEEENAPINMYNIYATHWNKICAHPIQKMRYVPADEVVTSQCCGKRCTLMLSM